MFYFEVKEDKALTAKLKARQLKPSYHFENILLDVDSEYRHKMLGLADNV